MRLHDAFVLARLNIPGVIFLNPPTTRDILVPDFPFLHLAASSTAVTQIDLCS